MMPQRWAMSNQCRNKAVYVKVEIYNFQQHQVNIVYFNVDINNVRKRRNNVVILEVKSHNVDQCRNNISNMTIFKKLKKSKKSFWALKNRSLIVLTTHCINNTCFRLWSVKKHGTNNVEINVGKYNAWYIKKCANNTASLLMAK